MDALTLSEKRARAGRLGGLQRAINAAADPAASTEKARAAFLARFETGHRCALGCDNPPIPPTLSEDARYAVARLAQQAHFIRMTARREAKRRDNRARVVK